MLDHNLGEPMPEFVRPEFLKHLEEFTESDKERTTRKFGAWEGMYINLAMKRVKIELGYRVVLQKCHEKGRKRLKKG